MNKLENWRRAIEGVDEAEPTSATPKPRAGEHTFLGDEKNQRLLQYFEPNARRRIRACIAACEGFETAQLENCSFVELLRKREADLAEALQETMAKLRADGGSTDPMEPFAYDKSWEDLARANDALLAKHGR